MVYVIGIIFLMIHISNSLYQKVYLQSVADEAVEMAQRSWKNPTGNFVTGEVSAEGVLKSPLYFKLNNSVTGSVEANVRAYLNRRINNSKSYEIFPNDTHALEINCELKNYVLHKSIHVTITDTNKTAFAGFRKLFGLSEENILTIEAEGVLHDPTEYIRNLDLAADIILTTKVGGDVVNTATEWRDKMMGHVEEFFQ